MKSAVVLTLLAVSLTAQAAPWNKDCVTWWGGKIPQAERTQENCPNGHSHWDEAVKGGGSGSTGVSMSGTSQPVLNPSLPTNIVTSGASYMIVPNYSGGSLPAAIITTGRR